MHLIDSIKDQRKYRKLEIEVQGWEINAFKKLENLKLDAGKQQKVNDKMRD